MKRRKIKTQKTWTVFSASYSHDIKQFKYIRSAMRYARRICETEKMCIILHRTAKEGWGKFGILSPIVKTKEYRVYS